MMNNSGGKKERGEKPQNAFKTIKRLYAYLAEDKVLFGVLVFVLLLAIGCDLILPLVIEACINIIASAKDSFVDFKALTANVGIFLFVVIINSLISYIEAKLSAKLSLGMSLKLRQDLYSKILSLQVSTLDKKRNGDLMSRLLNDTDMAAKTFSETIISVVSSSVLIIGCGIIMTIKCPRLAAISIGTSIATTVIAALFSGFLFPLISAQQASLGTMNSHVEESLKGFRSSILLGKTKDNVNKMNEYSDGYFKTRLKVCLLENMMGPLMLIGGNLNFLLMVFFGAKYTIAGVITTGTMQAFILYSKQFMEPVNSFGENLISVQNSLASAERIFSILDSKSEISSKKDEKVSDSPSIELSDVHFGYHLNNQLIKGLNLKIDSGDKLALVGKTGVGKTTIANLLLQFYTNYKGDITIDGKDISEYSLDELRSSITYISQEPKIIDGTIYDNITYGVKSELVDLDKVREATEKIGIRSVIEELPDGFNTYIQDGKDTLSQGQLQLICLTRAIIRNSQIIIMDESTSSVDMSTEKSLKDAIELIMEHKTCIVIAHRLSSIIDSDKIAVLDDGVIAEFGTHNELIKKQGLYWSLYKNQFLGKVI